MHTEQQEKIQDMLSDVNSCEPYQLSADEAKALRDEGFNVRRGQWLVMNINHYSQSHWILDNIHYIGNKRQAQRIADKLSEEDNW